jgi:hypothetical protein
VPAGDQVVRTDRIIVATGSDPAGLTIDGLAEAGDGPTARRPTDRDLPDSTTVPDSAGDRRRARPALRPPRHEGSPSSRPLDRLLALGKLARQALVDERIDVLVRAKVERVLRQNDGESSLCTMRARSPHASACDRPVARRVVGIGLEELGIEPTETAAPPHRHGRLKPQRSSRPQRPPEHRERRRDRRDADLVGDHDRVQSRNAVSSCVRTRGGTSSGSIRPSVSIVVRI